VILREGALPRECGHHRGLGPFSEFPELVPGLRPEDALAGVEQRLAGAQEDADRLPNGQGIGAGAENRGRLVSERLRRRVNARRKSAGMRGAAWIRADHLVMV
jgi:hypothetical protein